MKNDVIDHINLELSREKSKNTIACKKNDTALRRVQATVSNNGAIVNLEDVVYAVVKATKPDGTKIYNACTVSGDCLWFVVTTQMLTAPGDVICELEITWLDGATITTPTFTIHVYNTIYTGAESQNEYNGLTQAVAEAVSAKISAETAQTAAETAQTLAETAQAASELAQSKAEEAEAGAVEAKTSSESAQSSAEYAQSMSEAAQRGSESARDIALSAQAAAEIAKTAAQTAQTGAETAQASANNSKTAAETAETGAESAKTAAQTAQSVAVDAKNLAITAKDQAVAAEMTTLEAKDYVVQYIQEFIDDQEEHNQTLILAERYTDSKTEPIEEAIGDMDDLEVQALNLVGACNTLNTALKGKQEAESFNNYSAMVTALNAAESTAYKVGQSMYIVTLDVPDMWISSIAQTSVPYTYVDDDTLISDLESAGGALQIGYFNISILETQKVDLSSINSAIASLQGGLATANSNISSLQSGLSSANSDISALQSSMATANTNILALQTDVGVNTSDISALQTSLSTLNTALNNLIAKYNYPS